MEAATPQNHGKCQVFVFALKNPVPVYVLFLFTCSAEEMTSKMSSSMDEKNGHFVEDSPTMDPRNQRKLTKPPATPEERKRSELTPKTKKNSQLRVNTMERYLEDQYEHWTHRRPPTTFGFSSLEHPLVKPKVREK